MRRTIALFASLWMAGPGPLAPAADTLPGRPALCSEHRRIVDLLARRYAELPFSLGLGDDGDVLELLTSKGGESWTMLRVTPDGRSCVVATGRNWQQLRAGAGEPEA